MALCCQSCKLNLWTGIEHSMCKTEKPLKRYQSNSENIKLILVVWYFQLKCHENFTKKKK